MNTLNEHAGKLGCAGVIASVSLENVSALAAILASLVTFVAVLPVAIERWKSYLSKCRHSQTSSPESRR